MYHRNHPIILEDGRFDWIGKIHKSDCWDIAEVIILEEFKKPHRGNQGRT